MVEKISLQESKAPDVALPAQVLDIGMATHDARGRAGHIREDGIKRPAIPPVGRGAAVGNPDLGDETEAA